MGPIFLDELHCSGEERELIECERFQLLGLVQCDHTQDAGAQCKGKIILYVMFYAVRLFALFFRYQ